MRCDAMRCEARRGEARRGEARRGEARRITLTRRAETAGCPLDLRKQAWPKVDGWVRATQPTDRPTDRPTAGATNQPAKRPFVHHGQQRVSKMQRHCHSSHVCSWQRIVVGGGSHQPARMICLLCPFALLCWLDACVQAGRQAGRQVHTCRLPVSSFITHLPPSLKQVLGKRIQLPVQLREGGNGGVDAGFRRSELGIWRPHGVQTRLRRGVRSVG